MNANTESGFLYALSFCACYSIAFVPGVQSQPLEELSTSELFPRLCLSSLLLPLQGFFNACIYIRPKYIRVKVAYPNSSFVRTVLKAYSERSIPGLQVSHRRELRRAIRKAQANDKIIEVPPGGRNKSFKGDQSDLPKSSAINMEELLDIPEISTSCSSGHDQQYETAHSDHSHEELTESESNRQPHARRTVDDSLLPLDSWYYLSRAPLTRVEEEEEEEETAL